MIDDRRLRTLALAMFASTVGAAAADAQITYDGCRDASGRSVRSQLTPHLPDVAAAAVDQGGPVIYYNPQVLATLASQTRLFFYGHECGHHNLMHTFEGSHPLSREQAADCWAIVELWRARLLGHADLSVIQADVARSPGDWTHLPGPHRAINLASCLRRAGIDPNVERQAPSPVPRPRQRCNHPLHFGGDAIACQHPAHAMGDLYPCQHPCPTPYGYMPCHANGDVYPCTHPAHAADSVPCQHPAHPEGH
jgi:hypothetical protein